MAATPILDSWNFSVSFNANHLLIHDNQGITHVHYDNIAEAKVIPIYGVGIALKDVDRWLGTFEGKSSHGDKLRKISDVTKSAYGCEICITKNRLDIGVEKFAQEICDRISPRDTTA